MAVVGALELAQALGNRLGRAISAPRAMRVSLAGIMLATLVLGEEYTRLVWGRDPQMAKGTTDVTRYIREHRMESDVVMSPAAPAAAVELGGLDYYISSNMLFWDIPYRDGNVIRDRWGGGELVSNPEAFTRVFEKSDRVWIYYDELTESRLNPAMRHYVRTTGRPVMESYAATLRVWDRDRDPMPLVVKEGRNVVSY